MFSVTGCNHTAATLTDADAAVVKTGTHKDLCVFVCLLGGGKLLKIVIIEHEGFFVLVQLKIFIVINLIAVNILQQQFESIHVANFPSCLLSGLI